MKITHVHPERSVPRQFAAFVTDPPLSDEVFTEFEEGRSPGPEGSEFRHEDGLLILTEFNLLTEKFKQAIERQLTEAEEAVKAKKDAASTSHDRFVKTISDKTGIPIRPSSA